MRADLLLRHGVVHPLGRFGARAVSHLAVAGERVLAVGGRELDGLRDRRTRVVDLGGRCVLPGFDDAHAHVVYYGLTSFGADLTGSRSLAQLQARVRRVDDRLPPGRWLVARGYSAQDLAEGRPPVREELDAVVGERPMYADERGGHSRVASSAALALAGLGPSTPDPVGGALGRRPDGSLDGRLIEAAMRLVSDHQPAPAFEERMTGILRCQRLLLARGITSVGAAVNRGFADDLAAFQELADRGRLQLRVNEFLSWELLPAARRLGLRRGFGGGRLRAGPVKVFVDGGAAAGAVALRGARDQLWRTSPADLKRLVAEANAAGLQVAAHAVGDGAIEAFCDAVEAAGPPALALRHRVEHCTACPPDLQARLARLGMVAVMQPLFASVGRARAGGAFPDAVRPHLAAHRALLRAGVRLVFSSDLPVVPDPDPWAGIAAAVTDTAGPLTLLQALRAYTAGGAYVAFSERERGTLEPGMLADFQVLDADPFGLAPEKWPGLRPTAVAVAGAPAWGTL
ncbi:MAG TPA: amidohydrolase [Candidatus Dormibacteraeota bacterium]